MTPPATVSLAEFAEQFVPSEVQCEIDDEGVLIFTAAGAAWWRPRFQRCGYMFGDSMPVDAFKDIADTILAQELRSLPTLPMAA